MSLKMRLIFLLFLLLPLIGNAENTDAPAKFYDDLKDKLKLQPKTDNANLTALKNQSAANVSLRSRIGDYYSVKQNESLSTIATRYGYNYVKLAQWNDIPAPYSVVAGQKLKLFEDKTTKPENKLRITLPDKTPSRSKIEANNNEDSKFSEQGLERFSESTKSVNSNILENNNEAAEQVYIVGKHESLSTIATHFKLSMAQLAAMNAITSPDQLYVGQKLKIFKNKQKHSLANFSKKTLKIGENLRDNSQITSIISNNNKSMLKFYCRWPTEGKIIKNFSQTGGRGIEIGGNLGQAIKAVTAGRVVAVSRGIYGHGSFIVIQHHDSFLTSYANNKRSLVKNGQRVVQGQVIAEMGQVGRNQPSLEFEIRKNTALVNPMQCLPKKI